MYLLTRFARQSSVLLEALISTPAFCVAVFSKKLKSALLIDCNASTSWPALKVMPIFCGTIVAGSHALPSSANAKPFSAAFNKALSNLKSTYLLVLLRLSSVTLVPFNSAAAPMISLASAFNSSEKGFSAPNNTDLKSTSIVALTKILRSPPAVILVFSSTSKVLVTLMLMSPVAVNSV